MALTPLSDALATLLAQIDSTPQTEWVSLEAASGRYAAEAVHSTLSVPPADNSAMDGYAVRAGELPAMQARQPAHPCGSAATRWSPARPRAFSPVQRSPRVRMRWCCKRMPNSSTRGCDCPRPRRAAYPAPRRDIQPGQQLVAAGRCLQPQDIGLLASVGLDAVRVFHPLTVAILTTGDELREPGSGDLASGEIYNSNRFSLAAQIRALGMNVLDMGNLPDQPERIGDALERAAAGADCVLTAGGVSVGEEDHVRGQIESRGSLTLWKLAIKPGKPLAFGEVCGTPVFGLPGNPVSSWMTFALVAKPWLIKRQGGVVLAAPRFAVRSAFELPRPGRGKSLFASDCRALARPWRPRLQEPELGCALWLERGRRCSSDSTGSDHR